MKTPTNAKSRNCFVSRLSASLFLSLSLMTTTRLSLSLHPLYLFLCLLFISLFRPRIHRILIFFFWKETKRETLSLRGQSCPLIAPFVNSAIASHNKRRRNVSPGGLILPLDSIMTTRLINVSDYAPPRHFFFFFFQSFLLI